MSKAVLTGRHGIKPYFSLGAQSVDQRLNSLAFCHREGFANLVPYGSVEHCWEPQFNGKAHGVLHLIDKEALEKTLGKVESGYQLQQIKVEGYNKEIINARTFTSSPLLTLSRNLPPTKRYLSLLQNGAKDYCLDPKYTLWLNEAPYIECSSDFTPEYYETPSRYIA
eukprot:CAMPEP_0117844032 /NCGR_PEP_ID=MMETSP0949-20121206/17261_1 /TAXON_ID=44440 /ORGANISM="Chattonella subsalsa, Strain CCMP2191" /LENGTH=166 /DNA_ID=CAMNT_0005688979 /DNA_START=171 /DNA_END=668 /DNA_ORIENTATION=+